MDSTGSRLIQYGAEITGASAGALVELMGVSTMGTRAIVGSVFSAILKEFGARALSTHEQVRVGAVLNLARFHLP